MRINTPEAKTEAEEAAAFFFGKIEPLAADGFFYGEKTVSSKYLKQV